MNKSKFYYPDIFCVLNDGRSFIIEAKPKINMCEYINIKKYEALRKYCIINGYGYIMMDLNKSFEELYSDTLEISRSENFENEVLKIIVEKGEINWHDYSTLMCKFNISFDYLNKLILEHNLMLSHSPFRLGKKIRV